MADSYLAISQVANDADLLERMYACTTQQSHLGNIEVGNATGDAINWVNVNRYVWAASPSWGEKWDSALASHPDDPSYRPGADAAVITDADILSTVQALAA